MSSNYLINYINTHVPFACNVSVVAKNNNLVNIRKTVLKTKVEVHPVFLKADHTVLNAIVDFINNRDKRTSNNAKKQIRRFYEQHRVRHTPVIKTQYLYKNIKGMFDTIIRELRPFFHSVDFTRLAITWGRNTKSRCRSIRFGSFDHRHALIRIHPALDNNRIPDHFVASIIYHEIAHYIVFSIDPGAKAHGRSFYSILKKIDPCFELSKNWEKKNVTLFMQRK